MSLESPTTHLHIVGVLVFEPDGGSEGVDVDRVRDLVSTRLPLVPPFRQRMVEVPFGIQHPSMVDDPDFDIDFHVRRTSVPHPGGLDELAALAADVASRPLDRRRPLWEFHVVEGLEGGGVALIPKVHHSIVDGVSAAECHGGVLRPVTGAGAASDVRCPAADRPGRTGDGRRGCGGSNREERPDDPSWSPRPLPGGSGAVARRTRRPAGGGRHHGPHGRPDPADGPQPVRAHLTTRPVRLRPRRSRPRAPRSTAPSRRTGGWRSPNCPLGDVRRVRAVLGGTVNDVVLAVTGGAMRTFFDQRG